MINPFAWRESGVEGVPGRLNRILGKGRDQVGQHQRLHCQRTGHALGIDEQIGHILVHARCKLDGVIAEGRAPRMGTGWGWVVRADALRNVLVDALAKVLDIMRRVPRLERDYDGVIELSVNRDGMRG